jgi:hypothetical protein
MVCARVWCRGTNSAGHGLCNGIVMQLETSDLKIYDMVGALKSGQAVLITGMFISAALLRSL